jgi:hypothetical protein
MPADCLRVRFIKGDNRSEWAIETARGRVGGVDVEASILVTNIDAPTVCYTRRVTAVRLWDAMFLPAFGYMLAGYCARARQVARVGRCAARRGGGWPSCDAAGVDAKEKRRERRARKPPGRAARPRPPAATCGR